MVINKTPHPIHIVEKGTKRIVHIYPKTQGMIRLKIETVTMGMLADGTPLTKTIFGAPEGLPEYKEGTFYIVSQLVKTALPERQDLLVPAEVVRDEQGNIIGCISLGI
jgi:hypothetical protein